jgi:protein-S-isoprenylcysteine O-methyltransferase Ste14
LGRRAAAMLIVPLVVVFLLPWLLRRWLAASDTSWGDLPQLQWLGGLLGLFIFVGSLAFFLWCVRLLADVGRGTLAPWDPTQKVVTVGPYAHVRNPMISAGVGMLMGQALFFGSTVTGLAALVFFAVNHVYFIYSEEPGLEKRLGQSYREYKARVPRWIPNK